MKKYLPYIILLLIAIGIGVLLFNGKTEKPRKFDERITLRKNDKIPYGTWLAYQGLQYLFPSATITSEGKEPGTWDSLSKYESDQALIIVSKTFYADEYELKKLISFAEGGNDVFVSTASLSSDAETMFGCKSGFIQSSEHFDDNGIPVADSFTVRLLNPPFRQAKRYSYSGVKMQSWFYETDTTTADVLGEINDLDQKNFIHLRAGKGNFYVHLAPLTFSNYFLLRKNNIEYYEQMMSVLNPDVKKIVWDEYYLNKRFSFENNNSSRGSWLSELFKYKEVKWALLTAIFALLLYVLMEMRRRQRYIPVIAKPKNDSLDFVKTIGRLYFDKGDHRNLCRKMASYFLEHVRNQYKIPTNNLDEEFVRKLQFKTGCSEEEISSIIFFIKNIEVAGNISDKQLAHFHKQLESFYQKA